MSVMGLMIILVVAGLGWMILHVAQRRGAGTPLIDLSFSRNAAQISVLLLIVAGFANSAMAIMILPNGSLRLATGVFEVAEKCV